MLRGFRLRASVGHLKRDLQCLSKCPKILSSRRYNKAPVSKAIENGSFGTHETGGSSAGELVDFTDFETAYKSHKTTKLIKSLFIFHLCSYESLATNSLKLMDTGQRMLGRRLFNAAMKASFYSHFVGGEDPGELQGVVDEMKARGIGPILSVPMEEDKDSCRSADEKYDDNMRMALDCVSLCRQVCREHPMMQIKLTAVLPADLCVRLSDHIPYPNERGDIVEHLADVFRDETVAPNLEFLDETDTVTLQKGMSRLRKIGELAVQAKVHVMVDAEYTYLNPALNLLTLAMMLAFNQHVPTVSYTYQGYLKETYVRLQRDVDFIKSRGALFGVKLVRGAYLEKERRLAAEQGYDSPVHSTFDNTTAMYHNCVKYLLEYTTELQHPDSAFILFGTHNEATLGFILERMQELGVGQSSVYFGQVYGMGDYLTSPLAQAGYQAYKSIPYGLVEETLPYLYRRAMENKSLLGGTQRERVLLRKALVNRLLRRDQYRQ